jgi:nickel-dependent lactate racemase
VRILASVGFPYGNGEVSVEIADDYLGEIVAPRISGKFAHPAELILEAIENPIGSPRVECLAGPGKKVAIIVDDVSRDTPVRLILPHLIERLRNAGVLPGDIRIVIALGTHRPMTPLEIDEKIGKRIAEDHEIVNTACDDESAMVFAGTSSGGIPAWVNRTVIDADVRIGVGSITPHMDAGFSGGAKLVLPGVCSRRTVEAFHVRQAGLSGSQLGAEDAPLRVELESFVRERVGLDFIVNVIMDGRGSFYRCVAGDFVEAHRRGVRYAMDVYAVPVSRRYPLVISGAYPAQIDFWQASKAIASGEIMTRDGGAMILLAHCREGNRTHPAFSEYIGKSPEQLLDLLRDGESPDSVACAIAVPISRIKQRIKIAIVSDGLDEGACSTMGFTRYPSLDTALKVELATLPDPGGSIGILTHGGVSLPVLQNDQTNQERLMLK